MLLENADVSSGSASSSASSPSGSSADFDSNAFSPGSQAKKQKLLPEERQAFEDLVTDLEFTDDKIDEHLDLTLDEEMHFLARYKSLL